MKAKGIKSDESRFWTVSHLNASVADRLLIVGKAFEGNTALSPATFCTIFHNSTNQFLQKNTTNSFSFKVLYNLHWS